MNALTVGKFIYEFSLLENKFNLSQPSTPVVAIGGVLDFEKFSVVIIFP